MWNVIQKVARGDNAESAQHLHAGGSDTLEVIHGHVEVDLSAPRLRRCRHLLLEHLAREDFGIELLEVSRLLSNADEFHRHIERLVDGQDDSTPRRSIHLRNDETGYWNGFRKGLRLRHGVLSDGAIEHEKRLVRRARKSFADHAVDLLHLVHQRPAGVKASGGINDHDILAATDSRVHGVERHGGWVRAGFAADKVGAGPLCPGSQLVDRSRPKSVRRSDENRHLIRDEQGGQFPDEGRLACTIDAYDEDDRGRRRSLHRAWITATGGERGLYRVLKRRKELVLGLDQPALCLPFDLRDKTHSGRHAEVGLEKHLLELFQRSLNRAGPDDGDHIGQCDVFYLC